MVECCDGGPCFTVSLNSWGGLNPRPGGGIEKVGEGIVGVISVLAQLLVPPSLLLDGWKSDDRCQA